MTTLNLRILILALLLSSCGSEKNPATSPITPGLTSFTDSTDQELSDTPSADHPLFKENWDNGDGKTDEKDIPALKDRLKDMMEAIIQGKLGKNKKDNSALMNLLANALKKKPEQKPEEKKKQAGFFETLIKALIQCFLGSMTAQTGTAIVRMSTSSSTASISIAMCVLQALSAGSKQGSSSSSSGSSSSSTTPSQ